MPAVSAPAEILVTGASGFLGVHTCRAFLARGYKVRGTVRSPPKGEWLKKLFDADYPGKFSWVIVKDIGEPGAFDDAVKGVDAIAHTASPLELVAADVEPDVLIKPAVNGTTSVLKSAKEFGKSVKRVVTVSSVSALDYPRDPPYAYTTDDWNMASVEEARTKGAAADQYLKYCASKTLAERAFWDFISDNKDAITFDGATVLPPWIYGEVIHEVDKFERLNVSVKKLYNHLADPYPENEDTLGDWAGDHIHVDDVSRTLVDAIAREDLAGRRLLISQGALTRQDFLDAANSIKSQLPPLPFEIPKGKPGYGDTRRSQFFTFASEPTKKLLGHEFKQLPDMIKDVLQSLHDRGLLPKA